MEKITLADVEKIAGLARLKLTPEATRRYAGQLERILEYIDTLNAVPLADVSPNFAAPVNEKSLRADVIGVTLPRAAALQNAPQADDKFFQVPAVVK